MADKVFLKIMTGKIYDIVFIDEKKIQIILKKKSGNKVVPFAITVFGYYKDRAINDLKIKMRDKIRGNIYATFFKGKDKNGVERYYPDIIMQEIFIVEPAPVKMGGNLFDKANEDELIEEDEDVIIDTATGEIIQK